uniref:pentatricopeptide repeat-containing protein At1g08070-like n=1 Tax=Fragaria vesca subsp. vesca TaxID=101020 RepID=UPI0005C890AB|nr:PREDICTED: pentatricopeptide repeat-containing protein At1g08070-like [Fragaria vesca subsp. vesca]
MNSRELWVHAYTRLRSCKPITIAHLKQTHTLLIKTTPLPLPTQHPIFPKLTSSPHHKNLTYILSFLNDLDKPDLCLSLYNSIIQGLPSNPTNKTTSLLHVLELLRHMLLNDILPDHYTVPSVLKAFAQCRALREGQQIHAYAIKSGLVLSNVYVNNTIMRLYAVCGFINYARKVFDESPQRDLVSWTTLIQGYVKMGYAREGVEAFFDMCDAKMRPDEMTLVIVLSACSKLGDLSLGRKISRYIDDNGVNPDVFIGNALVNMYLECGDDELARGVFDGMPVRNVVSWNSMISGLAHQGKYKEALDVFQEMQRTGLEPDDVTLVGVLNSCANLGVLELGKWVHAYVDRNQIEADGYIGNALVDMYAKCGSIDRAFRVFQGMKRRDVYSYTAMIVGLAMHGEVDMALDIFTEMIKMGIQPDEVTFVGVLAACSHGGLVAEGQKYFRDMSTVYKLRPQTEHYGCMVDLLGRAGLIGEAVEFVNNMPIEPDAFVWGALLGACRIHGKVELAEAVMEKLLKVEPERDGAYVLMSNIYSSANKWRDAVQLRRTMKEKKMKKTPGCSSIEVEGVVHEFRKGDKSHKRSKQIYKLLDEIMSHINDYGVLAHRSTLL